ncbi:MAG: PD40 domain-containing protein [Myxococcales bacterium]|nr:PD40 domain-containing protein [Myxococcales bacterium]
MFVTPSWLVIAGLLAGVAGCRLGFDERSGSVDASPDGTVFGPWSAPQKVPGASSSTMEEDDVSGSHDGLELYFTRGTHVSRMTRSSPTAAWSAPVLASINAADPVLDSTPRLSVDDLDLYFASTRDSVDTNPDLFVAHRTDPQSVFGAPQQVAGINQAGVTDKWLSPCQGGRYVLVRDEDMFEGVIGAGAPTILTGVNAPGIETSPFLTPDCLTLYFSSDRGGTSDIFVTQRTSVSAAWAEPVLMPEASDPTSIEEDPWLSDDGRTFMFASTRDGTSDVFQLTR